MEMTLLMLKDIELTIDELYHRVSFENTFLPFRPDFYIQGSSFRSPPTSPNELTGILDRLTPATPELFTTNNQIKSDNGDDGDPDDDDEFEEDENASDEEKDMGEDDGSSGDDFGDEDEYDDDDEDKGIADEGDGADEEADLGDDDELAEEQDTPEPEEDKDEDDDVDEDDLDEEEYGTDWDEDDDDNEYDDDEDELKPLNIASRNEVAQFSPTSHLDTIPTSRIISGHTENTPRQIGYDIT